MAKITRKARRTNSSAPSEVSDKEIVRKTLLAIIQNPDSTDTATIQASRLLLDCGQENPQAEAKVASLFDAVRDTAQAMKKSGTVGGKRGHTEKLLAVLQEHPDGIAPGGAAERLVLKITSARNAFARLRKEGRAHASGSTNNRLWHATRH